MAVQQIKFEDLRPGDWVRTDRGIGTVEIDEFYGWLTVNNYPIINPTGPFKRGVLPSALFIEAFRFPNRLGGFVKGTDFDPDRTCRF